MRGPVEICAVILAAGEGRRLRPLTAVRPKALCPVGNRPLLDRALSRVAALEIPGALEVPGARPRRLVGPDHVAVNACYLAEQIVSYVDGRATLSVEPGRPLGTSGGLANLKRWVDGRAVLVGNADAYLSEPAPGPAHDAARHPTHGPTDRLAHGPTDRLADGLAGLLAGWDGNTVRVLGVPPSPGRPAELGGYRFAGFSLLPWSYVAPLPVVPEELVRSVWRPAEAAGDLEVVPFDGTYLDTGTPPDYLAANLHAAGGGSLVAPDATVTGRLDHAVVGAGAVVHGDLARAVVWPGGYVGQHERLADAVRVGRDLTVSCLPPREAARRASLA